MDVGEHRNYGTAFSQLFNCSNKCLTITIEDCGKANASVACALDRCDLRRAMSTWSKIESIDQKQIESTNITIDCDILIWNLQRILKLFVYLQMETSM